MSERPEKLHDEVDRLIIDNKKHDKIFNGIDVEPKLNNRWIVDIVDIKLWQIQGVYSTSLINRLFKKNRLTLKILHVIGIDLNNQLLELKNKKIDIKLNFLDPVGTIVSGVVYEKCEILSNTLSPLDYNDAGALSSEVEFKFKSTKLF